MPLQKLSKAIAFLGVYLLSFSLCSAENRPNIILVMTDDQGWGQAGYMNHPLLKTPNLNAMAENGLRFNRFYAAAPVCSPTRASVLTGRCNDRTGVYSHGFALRLEEKTLPQALKSAGYATGHFGKWHLDGLRGAGAPILKDDPHSPGAFGFDTWLSVTNFFDMNPLMSRMGVFEEFTGDSSEIVVDEAIKFIRKQSKSDTPFFTVIWYGSPHSPFKAHVKDIEPFKSLKSESAQLHHAEIRAVDRSIGTLRTALRDLGIADNTIVWFNSDNGGLPIKNTEIDSVGGLRGNKGSMWEGGLRVPGIIEWPAKIKARITDYPASTTDIMPTLLDIVGLNRKEMLPVVDGISLKPIFKREIKRRNETLKFHANNNTAALIDNNYKMMKPAISKDEYQLYDLDKDPSEQQDIFNSNPELASKMKEQIDTFIASVARSDRGEDYPNGIVHKATTRKFWYEAPEYRKFLDMLWTRPEFKGYENKFRKLETN